jgi:hypothetical protein
LFRLAATKYTAQSFTKVIELMQRNARLAGKIDQRRRKESERDDKKHRYSTFVLNVKEGAHKGDHHQ